MFIYSKNLPVVMEPKDISDKLGNRQLVGLLYIKPELNPKPDLNSRIAAQQELARETARRIDAYKSQIKPYQKP